MNYIKIYKKIIDSAKSQNRKKTKEGRIYENHHIIPKSVGGSNNKSNLVLLTPKEHYICHLLLKKLYPNERKLAQAYYAMKRHTGDELYTVKLRMYQSDMSKKLTYF
jgi:hypothetical protein